MRLMNRWSWENPDTNELVVSGFCFTFGLDEWVLLFVLISHLLARLLLVVGTLLGKSWDLAAVASTTRDIDGCIVLVPMIQFRWIVLLTGSWWMGTLIPRLEDPRLTLESPRTKQLWYGDTRCDFRWRYDDFHHHCDRDVLVFYTTFITIHQLGEQALLLYRM